MLLFKVFDLLFKRTIETSTDTIFLVFFVKVYPANYFVAEIQNHDRFFYCRFEIYQQIRRHIKTCWRFYVIWTFYDTRIFDKRNVRLEIYKNNRMPYIRKFMNHKISPKIYISLFLCSKNVVFSRIALIFLVLVFWFANKVIR